MSFKDIINNRKKIMIARQTVPSTQQNIGHLIDVDIIKNKYITHPTNDYNYSKIKNYPVYWKDITIPQDKRSMTHEMLVKDAARIEDVVVFKGNDKDGLLYSAANLSITACDFLTCGNATRAVNDTTNLLFADGYDARFGFNLILHKNQYHELLHSRCAGGTIEIMHVRELLRGGHVFESEMPHGYGLLLPTLFNHNYFKINIYLDWQVIKLQDTVYRIYASFELIVKDANMICRIENI